MTSNSSSLPKAPKWSEYGVQEYLLVINPNNIVNEKVKEEKRLFKNNYDSGLSIGAHPHITLAAFLAKESMEEKLTLLLQQVCDRHNQFSVSLNDFGGFPPHTIYIKVKNPKPFQNLKTSLKLVEDYLKKEGCPSIQYSGKPHLTVARKIVKDVYRTAIQTYGSRSFKELFVATELILLKRDSQVDKCKTVGVFELRPECKNLFN
jgi:2'-5' RNA ligase